jgi:hypothetical protein
VNGFNTLWPGTSVTKEKKVFQHRRQVDEKAVRIFSAALSDEMFIFPVLKTLKIYKTLGRKNLLAYRFSYRGNG